MWMAGLALAAVLACNGESPVQPAPLTDCAILGVSGPSVVNVGESAGFSAFLESCRPSYLPLGPDQGVWSSVDPAIASVSRSIVTGVAPGAAIIQITYGGMSQQALVTVGGTAAQPGTVPVRLGIYGAPIMRPLQRAAFGAFLVTGDGTVTRVSSAAAWKSSSPAVAGLTGVTGEFGDRAVDAFKTGSTTITVAYQGMTTTMRVEARR
jgi:hypothetical protein